MLKWLYFSIGGLAAQQRVDQSQNVDGSTARLHELLWSLNQIFIWYASSDISPYTLEHHFGEGSLDSRSCYSSKNKFSDPGDHHVQ